MMRQLIERVDYMGIMQLLSKDPALVNEGIPCGENNSVKAHPLHRICDGVFSGAYSDQQAVEMAKIFLSAGANVNGNKLIEKQDSPLVAAASLHADEVALLYIAHGANIHHGGCHGGTALHWAAWCGRDKVVKKLIDVGADIHRKCIDFKSTPLFWAAHGYKNGEGKILSHQLVCARMLIDAGAEKNTFNAENTQVINILDKEDREFVELLS